LAVIAHSNLKKTENMPEEKVLNEIYRKVEKLENDFILRNEKFFSFFKIISTLSVTLIGLLVSLKSSDFPNLNSKISFLVTISLLSLTVVFSLIVQYNEHNELNHLIEHRKEVLKSLAKDENLLNIEIYELSKTSTLKTYEKLTYYCLAVSLISLIFYTSYLIF
jgi:hypothetical protein